MNRNLPDTGMSVFAVMSALANRHHAVNLSQGFPDFPIDPVLSQLLEKASREGFNQYAPMPGLLSLREAIARKINHFQQVEVNRETEITITPGATYAIYTAFATLLNPGDEVIILEPAYDSYQPNIQMTGAKAVPVPLMADSFAVDWDQVSAAVTPATRAIIFNNPHNPSGKVWQEEDFEQLIQLVNRHDLYIIADEVYEHLVYDGLQHRSVLQFPELRHRAFAVYSFGKVFHNTGWKMGYCVAPPELMHPFRMLHQFLAFSINTPAQQALAWYLEDLSVIEKAANLLEAKRDLLLRLMQETPFRCPFPTQGSYFQLYDYSAISDREDKSFAEWLCTEHGVATIPLSPFYHNGYQGKFLRFCFAKKEATLQQAVNKLKNI